MRIAPLIWTAWLAVAAAGCAGYTLGPTSGAIAGARSIQVNFFQNKTPEPRLIEAMASSLRKNLQQDGTFRLDTRGGGDLIVNGVITKYDRAGLSFQPTDILTVRDFTLRITARLTVIERATGKVILDKDVSGETAVRVGADMASAEREAVPMATDDLAHNATSLLAEGTW